LSTRLQENIPFPQSPELREPYKTIIDRVNDRDRAFFDAYPNERGYLRPYIPGECPPDVLDRMGSAHPPQDCWVFVWNFGPGCRCRQPIGTIIGKRPLADRISFVLPSGDVVRDVPVLGGHEWE
jgi:hypothetical protein